MATQYTRRLLIVCNAAVAAAANAAAGQPDTGDVGGGNTFRVGLSATGNAPATHYWCSWSMRPAMATAIATRLRSAGATVGEVTPVVDKGTPSSTRFAVFDVAADNWTPDAVLTACGLQRVVVAD